MGTKTNVGLATYAGSLAATSILNRLTGNRISEVAPLLYLTYVLYPEKKIFLQDLSDKAKGTAMGVFGYYLNNTIYDKVRFKDGILYKILQAPISGVATIVGDQSRAASALFPAAAPMLTDGKQVASYLDSLYSTNNNEDLEIITYQLIGNGFRLHLDEGNKLSASVCTANQFVYDDIAKVCKERDIDLQELSDLLSARESNIATNAVQRTFIDSGHFKGRSAPQFGFDFVKTAADTIILLKLFTKLRPLSKHMSENGVLLLDKTYFKTFDELEKAYNPTIKQIGAFLAEPNFKGEFYSGEDRAALSVPAPTYQNQPAAQQLESAIQLSPEQKHYEGMSDFLDEPVVVVDPATARKIERSGLGSSVGRSRQNPSLEIVLMDMKPERATELPQGSLISPLITQASNVDVRTGGLFTRGTFTPSYGYRKGEF